MGFQPFGPDHWGVLSFTLVAGLILVLGASRIRAVHDDRKVRFVLALTLLMNELALWIFYLNQGVMLLPLQLCDLAILLMIWSLLKVSPVVTTELAFFWGLGASSQAIITPDLQEPFPSFIWFSFFASHAGVVLSAIYLTVRGYAKLTPWSVWRVWLFTNFYAAIVGLVNWLLGTNFGYLARKPEQPSLLDYLGPWPYYILWGEMIALGLFFLCYGFSLFVDRLASNPAVSE